MKKILAGIGSLALVLSMFAISQNNAFASTSVLVTPTNMNNWYFYNDQNDSTLSNTTDHGFVTGPATPPVGTGSVHLTKTTTDRYGIATTQFAGTALSNITALSFSTYRASGTSAQAPSLGFDIDTDSTATDTAYQGRLTYEPYFTQTVNTGSWQTWNTLDETAGNGTGNWWYSHANTGTASQVITACTQSDPCTWAQVKAEFPNAAMRNPGQFILRTNGADGEVADMNVDNLTVGISGADTTFNFDPTPIVNVITNPATGITTTDATLNGTNGDSAAIGHSFWVSTSAFSTASPTIPSGVYSTPDMGAIAANTAWNATLSSLTTSGVPSNMPAVTPNTTYYFVAWSNVGGTWYPGDELNFTTSPIAVTQYTLTYTAGPNGTISGTSPQTVNQGASGTAVTAVANAGFHFVNWSDASTANPRTDSNVQANISVTANFAADTTTNTPTNKDQCKANGWKTMVDSSGHSFKNQGDCVSFVATKGKN